MDEEILMEVIAPRGRMTLYVGYYGVERASIDYFDETWVTNRLAGHTSNVLYNKNYKLKIQMVKAFMKGVGQLNGHKPARKTKKAL